MISYRLQVAGPGLYQGQKAVRDANGVFKWKDVRVTVAGDEAAFSEHFGGGRVRYLAERAR